MLKTRPFWKAFFTAYLAMVGGIWGFVQVYDYFERDVLQQWLGPSGWIIYFLVPLPIAFSVAVWTNRRREETPTETLDQRNRRVMLDHVENFWVKGVLEKSLHGAALLELGMKEDPEAVHYPWTIKRETTNETLPAGKSMFEIFEEIGLGRSLLILGAPGSGKTTMLLELTRQLIELAREDDDLREPIPVVFNLASWTEKQTISDWLADQLNILYYVPKSTAAKWVSENKMLLLLDGLDEVKAESRTQCVEALNQFRKEHGLTSVVVCSRSEEYSVLNAKLSLQGAITIQSLSPRQINAYFEGFGQSLAGVKGLLKKDKDLEELAETPLMLSIMALAYKGIKPGEFARLKNKEEQRKHLFEAYIDRMFERRTRKANSSFTKTQALHYLSWLARRMRVHNVITYQIEAMQPSWLEDDNERRSYKWFSGLVVGLVVGLIFGLFSGLVVGLVVGLIFGLLTGLLVGLLVGLVSNDTISMIDRLRWFWKEARRVLLVGLIVGLLVGLFLGLRDGLFLGLFIWLSGGLLFGLSGEQVEETTYPGQRLRQTLFSSLSTVILRGLLGGLLVGLLGGLRNGLLFGLMTGLMTGVVFGLGALIQHFALRYLLIRDGYLPRRLIPFLDYAVDLIFLRRVGGSYIFIHRLIMEHFAEMDV